MITTGFDQQCIALKSLENRQSCRATLLGCRAILQIAAVGSLDQEMKRERNHHQKHKRLDSFRLVQKHGPDGERPLEAGIHLFAVCLLFESSK